MKTKVHSIRIYARNGNITEAALDCDVIVNAANPMGLGGGGVDGAIHKAAGSELRTYCLEEVPEVEPGVRCRVGEVFQTPAFNIPVKAIFHTVGPMFPGSRDSCFPGETRSQHPKEDLMKCIETCLNMAESEGYRSIAFPAISCGVYGGDVPTFTLCALKVIQQKKWNLDKIVFTLYEKLEYDLFVATCRLFFDDE